MSAGKDYEVQANDGKNVKITTTGDGGVKINSGGAVDAIAGTEVTVSGNAISIKADSQLTLAVGGNKITLDRNGINIVSNKYTNGASGPFDAFVRLDSASGVAISGMSCTMAGSLSSSISDGFGASVAAKGGNAAITGNSVALSTTSAFEMVLSLANFATTTALELGAVNSNDKVAAKLSMTLNAVSTAVTLTKQLTSTVQKCQNAIQNLSKGKTVWTFVVELLNLCTVAIDIAVTLMVANDNLRAAKDKGSLLKKSAGTTVTVRDAMRLASTTTKASLYMTAVTAAALSHIRNPLTSSSFSLEYGKLKSNLDTADMVFQSRFSSNSLLAGQNYSFAQYISAVASQLLATRRTEETVAGRSEQNPMRSAANLDNADVDGADQRADGEHSGMQGAGQDVDGSETSVRADQNEVNAASVETDAVDQEVEALGQSTGPRIDT